MRISLLLRRLSFAVLCGSAGALASVPEIAVEEVKVISPDPDYYIGWPTVAAKKDGELVVVYSGGRDYHVCPFGRVEMMTSKDGGRTWSWPRVIMDSATDDRDAGILETDKGTLLVTFFTSLAYQSHMENPEQLLKKTFGKDLESHLKRWELADRRLSQKEKEEDVGMWLLRSEDGGRTWSERQPAPCSSPHGPTQLRDGRLLYAGKELWTEEKNVGVWESTDDGRTWKHLANIPARSGENVLGYHEVHAVEAADGTIILHIRNHNAQPRNTLQTESRDGGKTWSEPHEIGVEGYPSHLLRLKDGTLLMTYSYRGKPFGIRGKISKDNGATWSEEFRLTEDGASWDLGYPSTVELEDGTLVTVWYEVPANARHAALRQARWRFK